MVKAPGGTVVWGTYMGSITTVSFSTLYAAYVAGLLPNYQVFVTNDPDTPASPVGIGMVEECESHMTCTITSRSGRSLMTRVDGLVVDYDEHYPVHYHCSHPMSTRYFCGTRSGIKHIIEDRVIESWEFGGDSMCYAIPVGMVLSSAYGLITGY